MASMAAGETRVRPRARCDPIDRRRRPTSTARGSRLWARAWRCRPDPRPRTAISVASIEPGHLADRHDPPVVQLARGHRPDAPEPLHRQRVQELELVVGRDDEQTVGLGHATGHLGQELGPRHPDGDRQPDALEDVAPQPRRDLRSGRPRAAAGRPRPERPRRSTGPRREGSCASKTSKTALLACAYAAMRGGTTDGRRAEATGLRADPSPCGPRRPWLRSSQRGQLPSRRSPGDPADRGCPVAQPMRRTHRGRHEGSTPALSRTYVRILADSTAPDRSHRSPGLRRALRGVRATAAEEPLLLNDFCRMMRPNPLSFNGNT